MAYEVLRATKMERSPRLTAKFCREVEPKDRQKRYGDGHGLYLLVQPNGAKSWVQRIAIKRHRSDMGLGPYPLVSLSDARKEALRRRSIAVQNGDPRPRKVPNAPTFREMADADLARKSPKWRPNTLANARSQLNGLCKRIGDKPVNRISPESLAKVVESAKPTMRKAWVQRASAVFKLAVQRNHIETNPCDSVEAWVSAPVVHETTHHKSTPYPELQARLAKLPDDDYCRCLRFIALTACRPSEAIGATRSELAGGSVWAVPASRMKGKVEHRKMLSDAASALVRGDSERLFPFDESEGTTRKKLDKLAREVLDCVPHGLRSSFSTWAAEKGGVPYEVREAILSHKIGSRTAQAYDRATYEEQSREVLEAWAGLF